MHRYLNGGELLFHPQADAILPHIRTAAAMSIIIANGYLLTPEPIPRVSLRRNTQIGKRLAVSSLPPFQHWKNGSHSHLNAVELQHFADAGLGSAIGSYNCDCLSLTINEPDLLRSMFQLERRFPLQRAIAR
jgi:hypothetical protein